MMVVVIRVHDAQGSVIVGTTAPLVGASEALLPLKKHSGTHKKPTRFWSNKWLSRDNSCRRDRKSGGAVGLLVTTRLTMVPLQ